MINNNNTPDIFASRRDRPNIFGRRNPSIRRRRVQLQRSNSSFLDMPGAWIPTAYVAKPVEATLSACSEVCSEASDASFTIPGAYPKSRNSSFNTGEPSVPATDPNPAPTFMPTPRKKVARTSSIRVKLESFARRDEEKVKTHKTPREKARAQRTFDARAAVYRAAAEVMEDASRPPPPLGPTQSFLDLQERMKLEREWKQGAAERRKAYPSEEAMNRSRQEAALQRAELARRREEEQRRREEEERKAEEAVRRRAARARRKAEAEARRVEEQRRAEEEKRRIAMEEHIRLQERIRQAQEERRRAQEQEARRAREEEARRAQEEQARRAQEEERRQQEYRRQQEEYARNTASPQQPQVSGDEISARYDHLWTQIKSLDNDSLDGHSVPWPLRFRFSCMEDINAANVEAFVMYPHRASMEGKNRRQRLRAELLHWHPDKFQSLVLPKILPYQREKVTEVASAVVQVLTELMESA